MTSTGAHPISHTNWGPSFCPPSHETLSSTRKYNQDAASALTPEACSSGHGPVGSSSPALGVYVDACFSLSVLQLPECCSLWGCCQGFKISPPAHAKGIVERAGYASAPGLSKGELGSWERRPLFYLIILETCLFTKADHDVSEGVLLPDAQRRGSTLETCLVRRLFNWADGKFQHVCARQRREGM